MNLPRAVLLVLCLLLDGCASRAFVEGRDLMAAGQTELGLAKLEAAAREDPERREYRVFYLRQREVAVAQALAEADGASAAGRLELAESHYLRALGYDPGNPRARSGLDQIATQRRHAAAVRDAEEWFRKGDLVRAEARARTVLAENQQHPQARALLLRIEERRAAEPAPAAANAPFTRPITLEFRDAPLRGVFEAMARLAGINFVFDRDVRQDLRVTIFVRNTSIEEVMRLILSTNQLERKLLNENSVLIYPNTPAKAREHQDLAVRTFYLNNIDTKQAQTMIRSMVKTRDLYADEKLNAVIVRDTPDAIRLVEKLIASIDLPEPEVMLEIEVMEISSSRIQEIGIRWPNQLQYGDLGTSSTTTTISGTGVATVTSAATSTMPPARINLNPRSPLQSLTYSVLNPVAVANLRADVGATNTLANPRIRVRNREKAKVHIGDKLPVFTTTSTANVGVSASVSYLDVGLKLDIEPNIYLDNEVAMKVGLEVSTVSKEVAGPAGSIAYQIGTRLTNTVLRLKDGETQILAGLINDEDRSSGSRVPGLGDIPILGRLFGSQQDTRSKTEIVLLITPRVLRNLVPPQVVAAAIPAGTEAQVGAQPLRLTTTLPRSLGISGGAAGGAAAAPGRAAPADTPDPNASAPGTAPAAEAAGAGPPPATPAAGAPSGLVTLSLALSGEVRSGREIGVSVGIGAGSGARAMAVDVSFDPAILVPVGAAEASGNATLNIAPPAPGAVLRFRVVGAAGTSTTVGIGGVRFTDGGGGEFALPQPLNLQVRP